MKAVKILARWVICLVVGLFALMGIGVVLLNIYKDEILSEINARLKETVHGDVKIDDYRVSMLHNFPHLSVTLNDIYLHGPEFERYHKPFLTAARVHLNVVSHQLLFGKVTIKSVDIEDGEVFIFKTRGGYSNTNVLRSRRSASTNGNSEPAVIDMRQINLSNVRLTFHDSMKLKHLGVDFHQTRNDITRKQDVVSIATMGEMTFRGLMLNAEKGSFLRDIRARAELNVELDSTLSHLTIQPSRINFLKSAVHLSGNFHLAGQKRFDLAISSDNVEHTEALQIVHDSLARTIGKFNVHGPIKVQVNAQGIMQAGVKPAVDVAFSLQDAKVTTGKLDADRVSLQGTFINHVNTDVPNDENNARLHIDNFNAHVDNVPVEATITLTDMKDPHLDLKAVFDTPLKNLNENFDSTTVRFRRGHFRSSFTYSGKLREYMDETVKEYKGRLTGQATISDGELNYNQAYHVNGINAVFDFTEKQFSIRSLNLSVNKNDVAITGSLLDFIPFFIQPDGTARLKLSIVSPKIDLTGVTKPRIAVSKKRAKARVQKSKEKMVSIVDRLNEHVDLNISLNIAQFVNRNFKASELKGQMLLARNQFTLKDLSMNFGGGHLSLNTVITDVADKISPISIRAKAKDVALSDFFRAFNDFNQKTFTHEKVNGKLTMDIDLRSAINEKLDLQMATLNGSADFTIRQMRLTNFEPMQRLSNFLMKGRDFSDVSFNDIHSKIGMRGTKMDVARMEVESTVISLFVEGVYDMADSTDLAVQVPLSNLRKRDQSIPPENIGADSRVGPSVFLRVRTDSEGKTVISYDPFKKFRKGKKNNATLLRGLRYGEHPMNCSSAADKENETPVRRVGHSIGTIILSAE